MDSKLQVLTERLVEFFEIVLVLSNLLEQVHALLDDILANDLQDFVLLERFARDVERQIFRVDDAFDEVEIFRDEVLAVVHDEHASDVKFDVVAFLLGLEEVEGGTEEFKVSRRSELYNDRCLPFRNVEDSFELKLALDREVFDGEMVFPIVAKALVESRVLFWCNLAGITRPERFCFVQLLILNGLFLDLFCLLLLAVLFVVIYLLDLRFFIILVVLLLFLISLVVLDLLINGSDYAHVHNEKNTHFLDFLGHR